MTRIQGETVEHLRRLLPRVGVTRVADVTGLDHVGIPVFVAIRPSARHLSTSQGKGLTREDGWISAVMEAVETFHVENPPPCDLEGDYLSLRHNHPVIDPSRFLSHFDVPHIAGSPLKWAAASGLFSAEQFYLPYPLVCLDSTQSDPSQLYFVVSTNGLAAGLSLEQALGHALLELIERDALAVWMKLPKADRDRTRVCPRTLSGVPQELHATLANAGLETLCWAVRSGALSVFRCAIYEPKTWRRVGVTFGSCAHLSRDTALTKAMLEAVQGRVVTIAGSRDDVLPDYYRKIPVTEAAVPSFSASGCDYGALPEGSPFSSYESQLEQVKQRLKDKGTTEAYWVNLTKPELGVFVVQAFSPQLAYSFRRM